VDVNPYSINNLNIFYLNIVMFMLSLLTLYFVG